MKNYILYISIMLVALCSCSKEQDHYFNAVRNENVDFTVVNVTVGQTVGQDSIDSASSLQYYYSFDNWENRNPTQFFTLTWYYKEYENFLDYPYTTEIDLPATNRLWIGGNNIVVVRFKPSCPEEKSAEFTFPDGTKTTLTRENPQVEWILTSDKVRILNNLTNYGLEIPIYAISKFEKNGFQYMNSGFILMTNEYSPNDDYMLYYDSQNDCWMRGGWLNNN